MTIQELERISSYVGQIEDFDIDQYIVGNFPETPLEAVMFGDYYSFEFKKIYQTVINRFKVLMQSKYGADVTYFIFSEWLWK